MFGIKFKGWRRKTWAITPAFVGIIMWGMKIGYHRSRRRR